MIYGSPRWDVRGHPVNVNLLSQFPEESDVRLFFFFFCLSVTNYWTLSSTKFTSSFTSCCNRERSDIPHPSESQCGGGDKDQGRVQPRHYDATCQTLLGRDTNMRDTLPGPGIILSENGIPHCEVTWINSASQIKGGPMAKQWKNWGSLMILLLQLQCLVLSFRLSLCLEFSQHDGSDYNTA